MKIAKPKNAKGDEDWDLDQGLKFQFSIPFRSLENSEISILFRKFRFSSGSGFRNISTDNYILISDRTIHLKAL